MSVLEILRSFNKPRLSSPLPSRPKESSFKQFKALEWERANVLTFQPFNLSTLHALTIHRHYDRAQSSYHWSGRSHAGRQRRGNVLVQSQERRQRYSHDRCVRYGGIRLQNRRASPQFRPEAILQKPQRCPPLRSIFTARDGSIENGA